MFQTVTSGRCRRLKSATDTHRERLDDLYSHYAMFGSQEAYALYLQATLASRVCLETMLEASHIDALLAGWGQSKLEHDLLSDIDDMKLASAPIIVEPKRASGPVDLATIIGTLYALTSTDGGVEQRAGQAAGLGFNSDYGARHLARQATNLRSWSDALKLVEITPFDDDDEERCTFAAIAALGAFEYNYHKVFNYVARQSA